MDILEIMMVGFAWVMLYCLGGGVTYAIHTISMEDSAGDCPWHDRYNRLGKVWLPWLVWPLYYVGMSLIAIGIVLIGVCWLVKWFARTTRKSKLGLGVPRAIYKWIAGEIKYIAMGTRV